MIANRRDEIVCELIEEYSKRNKHYDEIDFELYTIFELEDLLLILRGD